MKSILPASVRSVIASSAVAVVLASAALGQGLFRPAQVYTTTNVANPRALVADFTGDGKLDVAIDATDATTSAIDVFPGNGMGGLLLPIRSAYVNPAFAPAQEPTFLVGAADLNQDGLIDIVTTSACYATIQSGSVLTLHLNTGAGSFTQVAAPPAVVGSGISRMAVADLDGDGVTEIVVGSGAGTLVYSVAGSSPVFTLRTTLGAHYGTLVAVGDFNGDGLKDVAIGWTTLQNAFIDVFIRGPGMSFTQHGPFPTLTTFAVTTCPIGANFWLTARDLDGDGDDDLVIWNDGFVSPIVHLSDPVLVLGPPLGIQPTGISLGDAPQPVVADFDSDGIADILTGYAIKRIPPAFPGTSFLQLPAVPGSSAGTFATAVAAGDLDSDGDLDLIYAEDGVVATALNDTIRTRPCVQPGTTPMFVVGSAYPGNLGYTMQLKGLQPGAMAVLAVSDAPGLAPIGPCVTGLDLSPSHLFIPAGPFGYVTANAAGIATMSLPIPNAPVLIGFEAYAQWAAVDPNGPWVTGGVHFLLSASRKIVIW